MLALECDVVGVVADGSEVAAAAARLQPVVIVVDLNLPNVSGLDACRQHPADESARQSDRDHRHGGRDVQGGRFGRRRIRLRRQADGGARN